MGVFVIDLLILLLRQAFYPGLARAINEQSLTGDHIKAVAHD
jgi:hypothetical protein